jgi:hypothetical protein
LKNIIVFKLQMAATTTNFLPSTGAKLNFSWNKCNPQPEPEPKPAYRTRQNAMKFLKAPVNNPRSQQQVNNLQYSSYAQLQNTR